MRKHLILYHSHKQLKQWGINRNYLKYMDGSLSRQEIRQGLSKDIIRINHGG